MYYDNTNTITEYVRVLYAHADICRFSVHLFSNAYVLITLLIGYYMYFDIRCCWFLSSIFDN